MWTSLQRYQISMVFLKSLCLFLLQQTKRKLDDANKRLEFLYDKLREQTVSSVSLLPARPPPQSNVAGMDNNLISGVDPSAICSRCFRSIYCMFPCTSPKQLGRVLGPKCLCRLYSVLGSSWVLWCCAGTVLSQRAELLAVGTGWLHQEGACP